MDITKLVQQKLGESLVCKQAVECMKVDNGKRFQRFAAIVERDEEYSVFLFTSSEVPCLKSSDLRLENVIAVDVGLRFQAEAPPRQDKHQGDIRLSFKSAKSSVLLEMLHHDTTTKFLTEIITRSESRRPLSTVFSESSTSQWLNKYGSQYQGMEPTPSKPLPNIYISGEDLFDPLKHMNLQQTDTIVQATTDSTVSQKLCFDDDFGSLSLNNSSTILKSASRESLDKILNNNEDLTDSMEYIQKQSGVGLPISSKPVTNREKFIRQFITDRENEFMNIRDFKVFCGSWNVNGQSPPESLHSWLMVDDEPPDIYAIGFQELDLSKEAFIFTDSPKEAEWQQEVKKCINSKVKFIKVKSVRLVGVLLIVYIQEKHKEHVKYIDSDSIATGIMGFVGNKGGVSVRFSLHSTSLCFVNSHLAAHQEEFERRNSDYRDIFTKTKFKQFVPPIEIPQHDIVFWVGDLNYRIDLPIDDVKSCIRNGVYDRLYNGDQLHRQMVIKSDVFRSFEEGIPNFDPTYKFDPGTDNYDSSDKNRVPAWCDRILWRGKKVQQVRYDSHPQLKVSDHKPVSSLFTVGVKVVDPKRYKKVYEDIMKKLDRQENDYLPQIKLDKTECVFKDVKFYEAQSQVVTVANIGQGPLEFEFVNKLNESSYCKPWLKVTPNKSIIHEGQCCEVQVEVFVDKADTVKLNSGDEKLEDILVLHLTNGKDSFITVTGNYLVSSFGSSIEALIQMHGPIREVPVADLVEIERPGSLSRVDIAQDGGRLYMVPKEIWKLIDFLHKNALDKEGLFKELGRNAEIQLIRDCLDTGKPDRIPDSLSVHSVAESFLLFLECLAQPVIPYEFHSQCLASSNNQLLSKQLLTHLPDCHKNTFVYVCAFLRELLQHSAKNGLENKYLATMFGEVMLRQMPSSSMPSKGKTLSAKDRRAKLGEEKAKKAAFMYHFINHDIDL